MSSTTCTVSDFTSSFSYSDALHNRSSNTAGAPLPIIPRRTSFLRSEHAGPLLSLSSSMENTSPKALTTLRADVPSMTHTPPLPILSQGDLSAGNDFESSSSSATQTDENRPTIIARSMRIYDQRFASVCPPEYSTPTPAVLKARGEGGHHGHPELHGLRRAAPTTCSPADFSDDDDTPRLAQGPIQPSSGNKGKLYLNMDGLKARHASESHIDVYGEKLLRRATPSPASSAQNSTHGKLIRKKSGEPVKSSMKLKRPGLLIMTNTTPSKSEPSTPTHTKVVHFDAKLEHVKLFLAEQKPLAVSRDGSPTDTSGTDNEFPSFIYGDEEEDRKKVTMEIPNMPALPSKVANVALQSLELIQDTRTINGRVRVRNIAFEKWLAVRFTFDWWQTTSEVTARYAESVEGNTFDIFTFTIRLHDIWTRIEEKTLFVALKYIVGGQEFWDNNDGENYLVKFSKSQMAPEVARADEPKSDMVYLRNQLEQVVKGRDRETRRRSSGSGQRMPAVLTANTPLATRYDFGASLKHPWKGGVPPSPPRHLRTSTYPSSPNTIPWPPKRSQPLAGRTSPFSPTRPESLGSPRDADKEDVRIPFPPKAEDLSFSGLGLGKQTRQRRDCFEQDGDGTGFARRTQFSISVTSEKGRSDSMDHINELAVPKPPLSRIHSFPQPALSTGGHSTFGTGWTNTKLFHLREDNDSLSPSITSSSSASPSPSPTSDHLALRTDGVADREHSPLGETMGDRDNYSAFLNRFCFYTGSDSLLDTPSEIMPRSHSASSVEEFLWSQPPPTSTFSPNLRETLMQYSSPSPRSPPSDDVRSGSSTPTAQSLLISKPLSTPPMIG